METTCPHCSQSIEIDSETLGSLQRSSHFDCPSCSGAVPVPGRQVNQKAALVPGLNPTVTKRIPDPRRVVLPRAVGKASAATLARTHRTVNRNLLVLGTITLLTLGGVGIFLGTRNGGDTFNTKQHTTNEIIHNSYFTNLIASGATTEKDLDAVTDIRPRDAGFIGISKDPMPFQQAKGLANRTGATILDVEDIPIGSRQSLLGWLATFFSSHLSSPAWVRGGGNARVLDGSGVVSATGTETPHRVLLAWKMGDSSHQEKTPIDATGESLGGWTFVSWGKTVADSKTALIVTKDDVLICPKGPQAWYLMSNRVFQTMLFAIEFRHPKGVQANGGAVVVGSPGPRDPKSEDWAMRIPLGFEFKLRSGVCGQLELPRGDYRVELPLGQIRDGRRVIRSRQKDPVPGEWNKLEIECTGHNDVVAKLNGEVVNAVARAENVAGRIVLWPIDEVHFRNPTVTIDGKAEKLGFNVTATTAK